MATSAIIPSPKPLPLIGNLHQIPKAGLIQHLMDVARDFATPGIFKLYFGSYVSLWVSHPDLVAELSDETRFRKIPGPGLRAVRSFAGDGLFTAFSDEPNWSAAHNILMPAFSQRAMRGYFDLMVEVADALVAKWARRRGHGRQRARRYDALHAVQAKGGSAPASIAPLPSPPAGCAPRRFRPIPARRAVPCHS